MVSVIYLLNSRLAIAPVLLQITDLFLILADKVSYSVLQCCKDST